MVGNTMRSRTSARRCYREFTCFMTATTFARAGTPIRPRANAISWTRLSIAGKRILMTLLERARSTATRCGRGHFEGACVHTTTTGFRTTTPCTPRAHTIHSAYTRVACFGFRFAIFSWARFTATSGRLCNSERTCANTTTTTSTTTTPCRPFTTTVERAWLSVA